MLKVFHFSSKIKWSGIKIFAHEFVSSLFYKVSQNAERMVWLPGPGEREGMGSTVKDREFQFEKIQSSGDG